MKPETFTSHRSEDNDKGENKARTELKAEALVKQHAGSRRQYEYQ